MINCHVIASVENLDHHPVATCHSLKVNISNNNTMNTRIATHSILDIADELVDIKCSQVKCENINLIIKEKRAAHMFGIR